MPILVIVCISDYSHPSEYGVLNGFLSLRVCHRYPRKRILMLLTSIINITEESSWMSEKYGLGLVFLEICNKPCLDY